MGRRQNSYRTIWISDLHLGTRGCKAELLIDFLKRHDFETLYLVGDVVDGWRLRRSPYWNAAQSRVVQHLLKRARKDGNVVLVPGNHDEALRDYVGYDFGGISLVKEAEHTTVDGKRLWVVHGDQFDGVMHGHKWLAILGDHAYQFALRVNHVYNWWRKVRGKPYWSLSQYLKNKVKNAVDFIFEFEQQLAHHAKKRGFDGVVCGHIHRAEIREIDGILYANDGDWVESCTALVEHDDGRLEILDWPSICAARAADEAQAVLVRETKVLEFEEEEAEA
ncbi:MAG: UDP-2,3-diacylglucosamine diphosphatase [Planctomycetota bacterium]